MQKWDDKPAVKKGSYAEQLVYRHYASTGKDLYRPAGEGRHRIDFLSFTQSGGVIGIDVKAKAARTYYPDTGINITHYQEYESLIAKDNFVTVMLVFVDEHRREAYAGDLIDLASPRVVSHNGNRRTEYPLRQNGIIYFPLERMETLFELTAEDCRHLSDNSERSYEYPEYHFPAVAS